MADTCSSSGLEMVTVKEESEDPDYYQFNIPGNIECKTFTVQAEIMNVKIYWWKGK